MKWILANYAHIQIAEIAHTNIFIFIEYCSDSILKLNLSHLLSERLNAEIVKNNIAQSYIFVSWVYLQRNPYGK